jgi:hypothetical protein
MNNGLIDMTEDSQCIANTLTNTFPVRIKLTTKLFEEIWVAKDKTWYERGMEKERVNQKER